MIAVRKLQARYAPIVMPFVLSILFPCRPRHHRDCTALDEAVSGVARGGQAGVTQFDL
jgi:hypothetical protein